jgi:hypothetical protein
MASARTERVRNSGQSRVVVTKMSKGNKGTSQSVAAEETRISQQGTHRREYREVHKAFRVTRSNQTGPQLCPGTYTARLQTDCNWL